MKPPARKPTEGTPILYHGQPYEVVGTKDERDGFVVWIQNDDPEPMRLTYAVWVRLWENGTIQEGK